MVVYTTGNRKYMAAELTERNMADLHYTAMCQIGLWRHFTVQLLFSRRLANLFLSKTSMRIRN